MRRHVAANIVLSAAALAAGAAAAAWYVAHPRKAEVRTPPKRVPKVEAPEVQVLRDRRVRIFGNGSARPKVRLDIVPQVSGEVTFKAENFLPGSYVRADQVLFRIDATDYQQAVDAAAGRIELLEAQLRKLQQERKNLEQLKRIETERLELAQKTYEKARRMLAVGAGAENEVDTAQETLLARQEQLRTVQNQLDLIDPRREELLAEKKLAGVERDKAATALGRTTVTSPVTGRVLSCQVEAGERVQAGSNCGELYGTDVMELPVPVPAGDLRWIEPEALAACGRREARAAGAPLIEADVIYREPRTGRTTAWAGRVCRIEAGLEPQTRMATLVVRVVNPSQTRAAPAARTAATRPSARPRRTPAAATRPATAPGGAGMILDRNTFCDVVIYGRRLEEAFLLPRGAIQPEGTVWAVEDRRLRQRQVTAARFTDDEAMILPGGGIEPGDRVVTGRLLKAVEGMEVEAVDALPVAGGPGASAEGAGTRPAAR